jgi:HEAT repeat protein
MAAQSDTWLKDATKVLRDGGKAAQIETLHALGKRDDPRAMPLLAKTLQSEDGDIRALAMGKLVFLNNCGLAPTLAKSLKDSNPRVRQHALYALLRLKAASAANAIARLLGDADDLVRFNAVLALEAVGGRKYRSVLARAANDSNANVVCTAIRALAAIDPKAAADQILRLVANKARWTKVPDALQDVTLRLLRKRLGDKRVIAFLRKFTAQRIEQVRRAGEPLRGEMDLVEAACLLAEAGDATGLPVLHSMLQSPLDYSQERGLKGLAELGDRSGVPAIIAGPLQNGFYTIKLKAIRALGEIGDARALPAIASFFNGRTDDFPVDRSITFTKDDPDLRLTALAAISKIAAQNLAESARSGDAFESRLARRLAQQLS